MKALTRGIVLLALVLSQGCVNSVRISRYSDLSKATPGPIRVLATDSTIYDFSSFTFSDSAIWGTATHQVGERSDPFSGSLAFGKIAIIQAKEFSFLGTLVLRSRDSLS